MVEICTQLRAIASIPKQNGDKPVKKNSFYLSRFEIIQYLFSFEENLENRYRSDVRQWVGHERLPISCGRRCFKIISAIRQSVVLDLTKIFITSIL